MGDNSPKKSAETSQRNLRSSKGAVNAPDDWRSNVNSLKEKYEFVFQNRLYCDVCFIVGEKQKEKFHANKVILSVVSDVFDAMFSQRWSEGNEIEIPDVEPAAFVELLRFIYCEKAELNPEIVWSVLYASKKYAVDALKNQSVDYIKSKITRRNASYLLMKAMSLDEEQLMNWCLEVIDDDTWVATYSKDDVPDRYTPPTNASEHFLNIDIDTLCLILKRDTLTIKEIDLFKAILRWAEAECKRKNLTVNKKNQRSMLTRALPLIRFPLMAPTEFANCVPESGVLTEKQILSLLLYFTQQPRPSTSFNGRPRAFSRQSRLKIFVETFTDKLLTLEVLPTETINGVKLLIETIEDIPHKRQRLFFKKKPLNDNFSLSYYKIVAESKLYLVRRTKERPTSHEWKLYRRSRPYFSAEKRHSDSEENKHSDSDGNGHSESDGSRLSDDEELRDSDSDGPHLLDSDENRHSDSDENRNSDSDENRHSDSDDSLRHTDSEENNHSSSDELRFSDSDDRFSDSDI